jgi:hypothetical protein
MRRLSDQQWQDQKSWLVFTHESLRRKPAGGRMVISSEFIPCIEIALVFSNLFTVYSLRFIILFVDIDLSRHYNMSRYINTSEDYYRSEGVVLIRIYICTPYILRSTCLPCKICQCWTLSGGRGCSPAKQNEARRNTPRIEDHDNYRRLKEVIYSLYKAELLGGSEIMMSGGFSRWCSYFSS